MNLLRPNIRLYIAENFLKNKFNSDLSSSDLEAITEYVGVNFKPTYKSIELHLKIQRIYINMALIDLFLLEIPKDEQKLLYYVYHEKQNYTWIAAKLHYSVGTAFRIHNRLLQKISRLLFFEIEKEDYFCRIRIINLLHFLDMRISSLTNAKNKISLNINQKILNKLLIIRTKYRKILNILNDVLNQGEEAEPIIVNKILNPLSSGAELAIICNTSTSKVSRCLNTYITSLNSI